MAAARSAALFAAGAALTLTAGVIAPAVAGAQPLAAPLHCTAHASSKHPQRHSDVIVRVHTKRRSHVRATVRYTKGRETNTYWRTSTTGRHGNTDLVLPVSHTRVGHRVTVTVTVKHRHRVGSCTTSFTPVASN